MDFEKFTSRTKGFIQSAQSMALREGHQLFTPEHILKILLDDPEGLCSNLMQTSGADPKMALVDVTKHIDTYPKIEGSGAGQLYMDAQTARVFESATELAKKASD